MNKNLKRIKLKWSLNGGLKGMSSHVRSQILSERINISDSAKKGKGIRSMIFLFYIICMIYANPPTM